MSSAAAMEAMEDLVELSESMRQAASLLADDDPSDETASRRPSTFLNAVVLGNVVSARSALRALTSSPRSPTDLTRSGLFRLCAGSRQVGRSEQPHRPPRAGECATLSSFPSAAGMRLLLRLRWWLLWCSPQGRTERRGHL
jgi:hypothetical protein